MRCTGQKILGLGTGPIFRIAAVLVLALTALSSHAATVRVPSDQPTIQAGVDAATEGDTVLVAPGTYTGPGNYNILLDGKGLVVRSESGPAVTIIDCEGNGRGFHIEGPMAVDPLIDGFTITNGVAGPGAALWIKNVSITIRQCVFMNNHSGLFGGAMYVRADVGHSTVAYVSSSTFVGNSGNPAAFYHYGDVTSTLESCLVTDNSSDATPPIAFSRSKHPPNGSLEVHCSNLYMNSPYDWYGQIADQAMLWGNFTQPPLWCYLPADPYSVHAASPQLAPNNTCGTNIGLVIQGCADCWDQDLDGLCAVDDNCPLLANPSQLDTDSDGFGDACEDEDGDGNLDIVDNCPLANNPHQEDRDGDDIGDACDDDIDGDGVGNESDNCPEAFNPDQEDYYGVGLGDACCCTGITGDANGLGGEEPTIGDISVMIDAKFITGTCVGVIGCLQEADVNQSGGCNPTCDDITIGDISSLIYCLFVVSCSPWTSSPCLDCP